MVIAKKEWFEDEEDSNLKICPILDIPWRGAIYFAVMFGFPFIILVISLPSFIIVAAGYYQNIDIAILSAAWVMFSFADLFDLDPDDPPFESSYDERRDFIIAIRNAGWSISSILIAGASISLIYNIYTWNFYLGLFATTAFVACMMMAITKYKFEKEDQNGKFSVKNANDGE